MTPRQERFCQEFVKCGNAKQAAINAGYSVNGAKQKGEQLTKIDHVQKRIKELNAEIKNDNIIGGQEIQEFLTSVILSESDEEVIVVEGCGDGISEAVTKTKKPSVTDRIRAAQLLARMQGCLDNSVTVNVAVPVFGGEDKLED